jgi:hypothetical protein
LDKPLKIISESSWGNPLKETIDGKEKLALTEEGGKYFKAKSNINVNTGLNKKQNVNTSDEKK